MDVLLSWQRRDVQLLLCLCLISVLLMHDNNTPTIRYMFPAVDTALIQKKQWGKDTIVES